MSRVLIIFFKSALSSKVKKLIYTSSSAIYGVPEKNPVNENMIPIPKEIMGKAKYEAEKLSYYIDRGLDVIMRLNLSYNFGHGRARTLSVLFEWIRKEIIFQVLGKAEIILYQFIHADDLADAIISTSKSSIKSGRNI